MLGLTGVFLGASWGLPGGFLGAFWGLPGDTGKTSGMAEQRGFYQVRKRCAALLIATPDFQTFRHPWVMIDGPRVIKSIKPYFIQGLIPIFIG